MPSAKRPPPANGRQALPEQERARGQLDDHSKKLATATEIPGGSNAASPSFKIATVTTPSGCLR
jgi:hypothetical protein